MTWWALNVATTSSPRSTIIVVHHMTRNDVLHHVPHVADVSAKLPNYSLDRAPTPDVQTNSIHHQESHFDHEDLSISITDAGSQQT